MNIFRDKNTANLFRTKNSTSKLIQIYCCGRYTWNSQPQITTTQHAEESIPSGNSTHKTETVTEINIGQSGQLHERYF